MFVILLTMTIRYSAYNFFCKLYTYSLDLHSGDLQTRNLIQDWLNYYCSFIAQKDQCKELSWALPMSPGGRISSTFYSYSYCHQQYSLKSYFSIIHPKKYFGIQWDSLISGKNDFVSSRVFIKFYMLFLRTFPLDILVFRLRPTDFWEVFFMAILFILRFFVRNLLRESRRKNIFSYLILMSGPGIWTLTVCLRSQNTID